jgi:acetyl-CoA acetyltransferase
MGVEAVKTAMRDAGLGVDDVDGMLSYHSNDSTTSQAIAQDLGLQLNFFMDCSGGGSSTEALIGIAMGAIEAGMCRAVAIFRALNGYSEARIGGTPAASRPALTSVTGPQLDVVPYGMGTAAQIFQFTFVRHMYEYGTTHEQVASVKAFQSVHAASNPKAIYPTPVTVDDVLASRWVCRPTTRLLDCCVETDNATCIIVTSAERGVDLRQPPVHILSVAGRVNRPFPWMHLQIDPLTRHAGYYARRLVFPNADVSAADIQLTGCYDAFSFLPVLLFEAYGFCEPGDGGGYASSGVTSLDGARPNNTSGGQLCEGYTHGMNLVIENVRQLRHRVDDSCPGWEHGQHSYERRVGGCRQVRDVEVAMNMASGSPAFTSAVILGN